MKNITAQQLARQDKTCAEATEKAIITLAESTAGKYALLDLMRWWNNRAYGLDMYGKRACVDWLKARWLGDEFLRTPEQVLQRTEQGEQTLADLRRLALSPNGIALTEMEQACVIEVVRGFFSRGYATELLVEPFADRVGKYVPSEVA